LFHNFYGQTGVLLSLQAFTFRLMNYFRIPPSFIALFLCAVALYTASSCKKESFLTEGGAISFSADTLLFDTVFTAQGSATRSIRILNKEKQKIKISSIRLGKGDDSPYRLNVNGVPGKEIRDMELAGNDSMYVFAAVTIDPTEEDSPFLVEDNLIVTVNGNDFSIPVIGYGQNAHYVVGDTVLTTQTWLTDKPYVLLHNVFVDSANTLTIPAGARIYMHADARLFVLGTLKINGTKADSVVFQGDRIDRRIYVGEYKDVPGEWGGIYFDRLSRNNEINYAVLKNGGLPTIINGQSTLGAIIQVNEDAIRDGTPVLKITNSVIKNSAQYGLLAFNASILAENCLIADCQYENLALVQGGDYKIYDCTVATYGTISYFNRARGHITAVIQNYYPISQTAYVGAALNADIKNTILYGIAEDEVFFDQKPDFTAAVNLQNCIIKAKEAIPAFVVQADNLLNQDPVFRNTSESDYHLGEGSSAIGKGVSAGTIPTDLDGVFRASPPSIGCYEYQP